MAKLSARGRREIWRLERQFNRDTQEDKKSYDVIHETRRYVAMTDSHLLENFSYIWRDGQKHNYGWKDKGKQSNLAEIKQVLESKGYSNV